MNPSDRWFQENKSLGETINNYFLQHIDLLSDQGELLEDCKWLFNNGNSIEKLQVITLLAAYKLHFTNLLVYE
jgi:asparagine synthase (glutamine-hydrolysing)